MHANRNVEHCTVVAVQQQMRMQHTKNSFSFLHRCNFCQQQRTTQFLTCACSKPVTGGKKWKIMMNRQSQTLNSHEKKVAFFSSLNRCCYYNAIVAHLLRSSGWRAKRMVTMNGVTLLNLLVGQSKRQQCDRETTIHTPIRAQQRWTRA